MIEEFLRQLESDVRNFAALAVPELANGFTPVSEGGIEGLSVVLSKHALKPLTRYRIWLAVRWALLHVDSTVFTLDRAHSLRRLKSGRAKRKRAEFDRLARTVELIRELRALWDLDSVESSAGAEEPRSGTELDLRGLPDDLLHAPRELQELLRAVQSAPLDLLEAWTDPTIVKELLDRDRARHAKHSLGHYDPTPTASKTRDPYAIELTQALDLTLQSDIPKETARLKLVTDILNAAYPCGYRSHSNPMGFRAPTQSWEPRRVAEMARLKPRRAKED